MEGPASANGEAAPGGANEGADTADVHTNQQRDGEVRAANGRALLQGSTNQEAAVQSSANEETEAQEVTNSNEGPQRTNEDTGQETPTNEDAGGKVPTNEDTGQETATNEVAGQKTPTNEDAGHKSPTNEETATPATNKDTSPQAPTNQDAARGAAANEDSTRQSPANQDPTNDLAALPAAANEARDPWDWSLEEAWLRAPEEEEAEGWGAEPEGWGAEPEGWGAEPEDDDDDDDEEGSERWQPSPDGSWAKLIVRPGRGLARPGLGSLCHVHLSLPPGSAPCAPPAATSGCGHWASIRLGTAEGSWARLLDAALESMRRGERARLRPARAAMLALTVQLGSFTPAPPFWEAPAGARWHSVTSGHARAAALLARGQVGAAGHAYSRALRAAIAAGGSPPLPAELGAVKAELHAGLALVQLRLGIPAAAATNAGKALALRPGHHEARYRRALAQAAMMDLEAAMADLLAVLRAVPGHAAARRELRRVRGAARERDARLARRLGRLFA